MYHHNYKVVGEDRIYYDFVDGLPDVLQVASHYFIDTRIGQLWKTMMHTAWTTSFHLAGNFTDSDNGPRLGHMTVDDGSRPLLSNRRLSKPSDSSIKWHFKISVCVLMILLLSEQAVHGGKTCSDIAHKAVEELHTLRGQSRFQLQERLEHSWAVCSHLLLVESDDDGAHSDEGKQDFTVKSQRDRQTMRAQFGRNRTCCEVLIVLPCGLIWKWTTMYKAEAVGAVAHVKDDPFFKNIGLSVDMFHFNCKHSKADTFCQEDCNPAAFPELTGDNGTWYFNSSACEQANAWFGKYNPITWGMRPEKYDFFLDEMITCRNEVTLEKLKKGKCKPSTWPLLNTFE
ncbi:hypothetical protein EDB19DRAFT_1835134 [Suillus lakei]|nr:hypothetical protein EDB19DRAFT_1835134 [Suillus lakei]